MFRIVTDSAADVPVEWQKEFDIQVIPANIQFREKSYLPGVDLDQDDFYRIIRQTRQIPKTTPPSVDQFSDFYQKIASRGDSILSIHVTSKLSQTLASATSAAADLGGSLNIIPFDSLSGTAGIGILCREARIQERAGKSIKEIIFYLEQFRYKIGVVLTLDTLEYARMSGRVGRLQSTLASILNVKPIVRVIDGELKMAERVRSRNDSLERVLAIMTEEVGEHPVNVIVVHAHDEQAGNKLMEQVRTRFNVRELILNELSLSVAANLGPGTVGVAFCPVE